MRILRREMILAAAAMMVFGSFDNASANQDKDDDAAVTALFNKIRREYGLSPVKRHPRLVAAALYQVELMAKHDKLKHSVGIGRGFRARIGKAGIQGMAAENIASGQTEVPQLFAAWMSSSGHRRNMLDPHFIHYGLACAHSHKKPNYPYWAMILSS